MNITPLIASVSMAWTEISPLILYLIGSLFLLLIGYLIARGLAWGATLLLRLARLDAASKQIGLSVLLEKGEIKKSLSELIGDLIYWVVVFISLIGTAKVFGLPIEPALSKVFAFLGLVLLAALILGIGAYFATLISGIVKIVAASFGVEGAKTLSRVVYYIVIIFTFLAALSQLGIGSEVFVPQLGVIIGAFGLAAAIAFGLGCKDMAADFLHNLFKGK